MVHVDNFIGNSNYRRIVISSANQKRVLGYSVVEMTCGLVHASYSLPEWQVVKLTFFAPCMLANFPRSCLPTINHFPVHYQLQTLPWVCKHRSCSVPWRVISSIPRQWNFTGCEMLIYHILNIIPHTFYRRAAIKSLWIL